MTDHLPENRDDWPTDPFELLNVPRDIDARGARRAYTKLARRFKPEHSPLEFQLIRAAYDTVLSSVGDGSGSPAFGNVTSGVTIAPSIFEAPQLAEPAPVSDDLEEHWRGICGVGEAGAAESYETLCKLAADRMQHNPAVYIRLHWALVLNPELDAARKPIDWLVTGLIVAGANQQLVVLYVDWLQNSRIDVRHEQSAELLAADSIDGGSLAHMLAARWECLAELREWGQLFNEVIISRERVAIDRPDAHMKLVLRALELGTWARDERGLLFYKQCVREVQRFEEVHLRMEKQLGQAELYGELRIHVENLRSVPDEVLTVIRRSVTERFEQLHGDVANMLAVWMGRPAWSLTAIDELLRQSPLAVYVLYRAVEDYFGTTLSEVREPIAAEAIEQFMVANEFSKPAAFRVALLEFCKFECIRFDEFLAARTGSKTVPRDSQTLRLFQHLDHDLSLFCLVNGSVAFLAASSTPVPQS